MKKKISFILSFLICAIFSFAQTPYPNNGTGISNDSTLYLIKGATKFKDGSIITVYADTLTANAKHLSFYPGALIMVGNSIYYRDSTGTKWTLVGSGSSGCPLTFSASSDSLYLYIIDCHGDTLYVVDYYGDGGGGTGGYSTDNWDSVLTRQSTPISNDHTVDFGGHNYEWDNLGSFGANVSDGSNSVDLNLNRPGNSSEFEATSDSFHVEVGISAYGTSNSTEMSAVSYNSGHSQVLRVSPEKITFSKGFGTNTNLLAEFDNLDSSNADLKNILYLDSNNIMHRGYLAPQLKSYTVSTLPSSPTQGDEAAVTDATSPTYLGALTGGGSTYTPVIFNGTIWISH